jgi:predicted DNA-binding transcriptional regulator AlpA
MSRSGAAIEHKDRTMDLNDLTRQAPVKLLGWDDLRAKGIKDSKPTIYRKIKTGQFPRPFPRPVYPGKSPAWPEHEIDAHILSLIAKRDASVAEVA